MPPLRDPAKLPRLVVGDRFFWPARSSIWLTELTPPKNRPLYARFCDQTFAFSELARGLSSSANCLAFLPRSSLGWLFVGFPALQFTEKAFPLKLLFQNPQCLIDIIVTNENFQSGFLS